MATEALLETCLAAAQAAGDRRLTPHAQTADRAGRSGVPARRPRGRAGTVRAGPDGTADARRPVGLQWSLHTMGRLAQDRREYATARACFAEALAANRRASNAEGLRVSLFHLGDLALDRGEYGEARALLKRSLTHQARLGYRAAITLPLKALAGLAAARQALGPAARAARAEDRALTLEQAIAYVLEDAPAGS